MRKRTKELEVGFIGDQRNTLTKEEQLAIGAFIQQSKEKRSKSTKSISTKLKKRPS